MAKILNKDPVTYQKERDGFLRELRQFHDSRGTPFRRVPKIHGHEVDLYLLYVLVTAHGGWEKVNSRSEWDTLSEQFGVPRNCVNGGIALKQIYIRFLERYEKLHFLGEDVDRDDEDGSGDGRNHRRWSARVLHSVPLAYNHHQHLVSDQARVTMGLSTEMYKSSEYDRLSLSLLCPLPNEHDFAINVCTLLSNEGKHTLRLEKCPRLVDFLLAHAGVYTHGSLRETFTNMFTTMRHQSVDRFWSDIVEDLDFRELTCPPRRKVPVAAVALPVESVGTNECESNNNNERLQDGLQQTDSECDRTTDNADCEMVDVSDSKCETVVDKPKIRMIDVPDSELPTLPDTGSSGSVFWPLVEQMLDKPSSPSLFNPEDYELFSLGRGLGTQDPLGQRVMQVATIMRNLSFEEENIPVLGKNPTFIRFSLLCSQSHYSCLSQLGLDMLGQVAGELVMEDPQTDTLAAMLISSVTKGLSSPDRFVALSCLEVLNKISQNEENEEVMLKCLEQKVYEQICSFLTLHDIMLLIYTLECLYSLSSLGERACNSIVRVHGAIDTLVSLITVEAQSYGPRACILMRVVERLPDQTAQQSSAAGVISTVTTLGTQTPTMTQLTNVATPVTPVRAPVIVNRPATITPQRQLTPVTIAPAAASNVPTLVQSPQQLQQQHQQQQQLQENEQFALAWLRATYEPASGSTVEQTELYRQYLASCAKIGRRGVIASLHFPRCVRSVFGGTVGPNAKQRTGQGSTTTEYHYEGIKVRKSAVPLLASPPASTAASVPVPHSPSLPAAAAPSPASPTAASLEPVPPAISPILKAQLSAPPKPRETTKAEAKSQVAQRQQQQRLLQQQLQAGQPTLQPPTPNATNLPPPAPHVSPPPLQPITPARAPARPTILRAAMEPKGRQVARVNGARGVPIVNTSAQQSEANREASSTEKKSDSVAENHVAASSALLPPPPPKPRLDEDSDSAASTANSLVSSSGAVSTDGDGENSLTSFEGILLNGIPHSLDIDAASNDGSQSCDSAKGSSALKMKGMLADLLEKKVITKEPVINGVLGKEIRISDKGLEIVENHIDKVAKPESKPSETEQLKLGVKRSANGAAESQEAKKALISAPINGNAHSLEVNSDSEPAKPEEKVEVKSETPMTPATAVRQLIIAQSNTPEQAQNQQQLIVGPRQIIMAPGSLQQGQVMISQGQIQVQQGNPQLKGQIIVQPGGQRQVLVQNPQMLVTTGQMMSQGPMLMTQAGGGQFIVTQALQGSIGAPGQAYVVAQSQGLVQGQAPTVLVTQTPQQQGTNAKTIIILHQQAGQKLPTQGQQVMVQLPRSAVQGGSIQGLTLSQGAGGQMMVSLPGAMPMMAKTVSTTSSSTMVQAQRILAPTKPVGVSTIVQNPAKKLVSQPVSVVTTTMTATTPSKPPATTVSPAAAGSAAPPRPATPRAGDSTDTARANAGSPVPTTATTTTTPQQQQKPAPEVSPFLCEWRGCMRNFKSANEVYMHACRTHCPTGSEDVQCLWERCDGMKRKRFSLMTHLYDRHCNNDVLRMMAVRRKQMAQSGRSEIPPPQPPPPHPGYAPNAALHAIKRHALEFVNPKELMQRAAAAPAAAVPPPTPTRAPAAPPQPVSRPGPGPAQHEQPTADTATSRSRLSFQDDNEGPVTKSIRLTSSLILRNLVIYSTNGRRFLRSYEPHLASVALSNVESSRTIAQVLYDMSQRTEQS